jgi:LysR family transcriptional activator of glutamate synthase operon
LDFHQIRYFQKLAEVQNFSQAATELSLSQPALSRSISRLEEEVGVPLFERKSRGVEINKYGKIFLQHVTKALMEIEQAKEKIQDLVHPFHGTVSLGFVFTHGLSFVPELCGNFHKLYPNVNFNFTQAAAMKIVEQVEANEIDVGICSLTEPLEHLNHYPILREEVFLLVPKNHRLANAENVSLEELKDEEFVLFNHKTAFRSFSENLFREAGFIPKASYEAEEERTLTGLVGAGFGITLMHNIPEIDQSKISIIPINKPKCERMTYMIWRKEGFISPASESFIHFVTETIQEIIER